MRAKSKVRRRRARGYTAVELMLAIGLFAVGITGIIAMQKVTVVSNQHAKNLAIATNIAEGWLDQLAADSTMWSGDLTKTDWLEDGTTTENDGNWMLPADAREFGRAFDALGAPMASADAANARFCTQIRLTTLYSAAGGAGRLAGNGLLRAEVRVFWLRDGGAALAGACTDPGQIDAVGASTSSYHRVYKVTAVRQHGTVK